MANLSNEEEARTAAVGLSYQKARSDTLLSGQSSHGSDSTSPVEEISEHGVFRSLPRNRKSTGRPTTADSNFSRQTWQQLSSRMLPRNCPQQRSTIDQLKGPPCRHVARTDRHLQHYLLIPCNNWLCLTFHLTLWHFTPSRARISRRVRSWFPLGINSLLSLCNPFHTRLYYLRTVFSLWYHSFAVIFLRNLSQYYAGLYVCMLDFRVLEALIIVIVTHTLKILR